MAARSRRRIARMRCAGTESSGGSSAKALEVLQLADVLCSVCRSLLVEPVSLPCRHRFCRACWLATDALKCPLCRTRVGSWLRESARRNLNLVDEELWQVIRDKFPEQLATKLKGGDVDLPIDTPAPRLSAPGEIRAEYEAELQRLRTERLQLERQHSEETALLVRRLQEEEEAAHKAQLEKLKLDEQLAKELQDAEKQTRSIPSIVNGSFAKSAKKCSNPSNKRATIDRYLVKKSQIKQPEPDVTSLLITGTDTNNSKAPSRKDSIASEVVPGGSSPEMVPSYSRFFHSFLDKKLRHLTGSMMQKETSGAVKIWEPPCDAKDANAQKEFSIGTKPPIRTKGAQKQLCPIPMSSTVQSMPVSLPYSGLLNQKLANLSGVMKKHTSGETDSVDSMRQELCYFKPIQATLITSRNKNNPSDVVRVPAVRGAGVDDAPAVSSNAPSSASPDYIKGLRQLRGPLAFRTPSAFVCIIKLLQGEAATCDISEVKCKTKKISDDDFLPSNNQRKFSNLSPTKEKPNNNPETDSVSDSRTKLRRTRSTGNIPKLVNESVLKKVTPKNKRSDAGTKGKSKSEVKNPSNGSPSFVSDPVIDYKKVRLVTKNLSSLLQISKSVAPTEENCGKPEEYDVESNNNNSTPRKSKRKVSAKAGSVNGVCSPPNVGAEQLARLEQERCDLEFARRLQAEWNGQRTGRAATKRTLVHQLTFVQPKKMKA